MGFFARTKLTPEKAYKKMWDDLDFAVRNPHLFVDDPEQLVNKAEKIIEKCDDPDTIEKRIEPLLLETVEYLVYCKMCKKTGIKSDTFTDWRSVRSKAPMQHTPKANERWGDVIENWKTHGVNAKRWIAHGDTLTRTSHRVINGQTRLIDEPFICENGTRIQYPGDQKAPETETAGCRCVLCPVTLTDDEIERLREHEKWRGY
jgi:hypothetical protein